jgi:general secretion pathway protein D
MKSRSRFAILALSIFLQIGLFSQTIAEKKASTLMKNDNDNFEEDDFLHKVNKDLVSLRTELNVGYAAALQLYGKNASEEEYRSLLNEINKIKGQIANLENQWRDSAVSEAKKEDEGYALWDQEETTLAQLIMEYGAMDYLYIIPPEMAGLKLNMHSNIPIPREAWNEMLEIILAHNGFGVKKINAYARQLFVFKQDPSAVQTIASRPEHLKLLPNHQRVCYIFSPPVEQIKSVFQFFERFSDAKQTFVHQVSRKIAIVSSKDEIEKLLSLYDTVWEDPKGKVCKVIALSKIAAKEMEKILHSFFGEGAEKNRPPFVKVEQEGLSVLSLGQGRSIILIGQQEVVERAEKIVQETENQLQDPSEMTVYMYPCRHSDPNDLAKVLERVYSSLLLASSAEGVKETTDINYSAQGQLTKNPDGYPPNVPPLVVQPPPTLRPEISSQVEIEQGTDHFIADPKTGNLLMVVRRDVLTKIKELLRKLDVPKKMVQIEVLLFERRLNNQNNFGLNLLKLGSRHNHVVYESNRPPRPWRRHVRGHKQDLAPPDNLDTERTFLHGVLEFFFSGGKSKHFPAFDIAYNFLMTQDDIQLNAAPSIITVNQTPATISIVEEISINNGAAPINTSSGQIAFEQSFSRAEYGITLVLTPTVHLPDEENEACDSKGFVTMQTNISFDTITPSITDRPMVDKRHIENEVRVVDGQTVILGGLRRKTSIDSEEKIPFLGELPGIGKLFGTTKLTDNNTEMIFFITPKIVQDPKEELDQIRAEELKKRAGDIPEFLARVIQARDRESKKFFRNSFRMIFGN